MKRSTSHLLIFCLLIGSTPSLAEIGAEDVQLPGTLNSGLLFATTSGDLINCRPGSDRIEFNRSTDNGLTWSIWSTIGDDGDPDTSYLLSDVLHVDATTERVFVSYRYMESSGGSLISDKIVVAYANPGDSTPSWAHNIVATATVSTFVNGITLTSDAENYADYNVYLAYPRQDADGNDIWFTRSTDKGLSFAAPYKVAGTSSSDRHFKFPDLDYGLGGIIHLVWQSDDHEGSETSVMNRFATGRASSGLNWSSTRNLTSHSDGLYEGPPTVAAGKSDGTVVITYEKYGIKDPQGHFDIYTEILNSTNYGGAYSGPAAYVDLVSPKLAGGPGGFAIAVRNNADGRSGLLRPSSTNLGAPWIYEPMMDGGSTHGMDLVSNPAKGDRWAMVAVFRAPGSIITSPFYPWFDAEWFRDPGYPVLTGELPPGTSDICLADLEGDGLPEIIYVDNNENLLHAYDGQLEAVPGFPASIQLDGYSSGYPLENLACGDVDGDGDLEIFVGSLGMIHGYDHHGQSLPGWPIDMMTGYLYRVSLGTVSRSAPMDILAVASQQIHLFRIDGSERGDSPIIHDGITLGSHQFPLALGDVDNDGETEMVATLSKAVMILGFGGRLERMLWSNPGSNYVQPARLVDMDLDGDLEIAFSVGSTLYLMHHDGSSFGPAWPWTEPEGRNLTPMAVANNLGTSEPEITFGTSHGAGNEKAYSIFHTGTIPAGWPNDLGSGFMAGVPLVDQFRGFPSGSVFLPTGGDGFGFKNFFGGMEGWPHPIDVFKWTSGASGDIDGDGLTEFITPGLTRVYDTHGTATSQGQYRWPMSRFDSEGTSCANCVHDRVTSAPDEPLALSRISFRGGYPNPFSGQTSLQYELPVGSAVRLEIFDIRGRKVREILRIEQAAGTHAMVWDRRDNQGQPVAGGTYLARLTARGPGIDQVLTRKITVIK